MTNAPNGGGGPKEPSSEDLEKEMQEAFIRLVTDIAPPGTPRELVLKALDVAGRQEMQVSELYGLVLEREQIAKAPYWGFELLRKGQPPRRFVCPKRLEECDEAEVMIWLASFGAILAPVLRAVLMTHGYKFEWKNVLPPKGSKPGKKGLIIMPGDKS